MLSQGISIIVCCYNSTDKLYETLTHLAKQRLSKPQDFELVIVDNNSSDGTSEQALELWEKLGNPFQLTIVPEPKPGLSNARKKGIEVAKNDYLIFCDDDNWLEDHYLEIVKNSFDADQNLAIIGGRGIAVFEDEEPEWFPKFYQSYAVGQQASHESNVNNVFGAGMAIRKNVFLESYSKFGPLLLSDRKGKELSAGGDTEICLRARLLGYKILYTDKLIFRHYLTTNRLTWDYVNKLHLGFAHTFVPLKIYEQALNNEPISSFFWLNQSLFYFGRVIKYGLLSLKKIIGNAEFDTDVIRIKSWYAIASDYLSYNLKLKKLYKKIKR
jgi:glycosyltransferase involved in cell wall biosynthesis